MRLLCFDNIMLGSLYNHSVIAYRVVNAWYIALPKCSGSYSHACRDTFTQKWQWKRITKI